MFYGLGRLGVAEVFGVVFEDDVGHGLLALLEGGRVLTGDFSFRKGFAVDVGGHHPSAVVVAEVDVLEPAAVAEGYRLRGGDLLFRADADGHALAVDGDGLEAGRAQLPGDFGELLLRHVGVDHVLLAFGVDHPQAAVGDLGRVLGVIVEGLVEHAELALTLDEGYRLGILVLSYVLPQADDIIGALPGAGCLACILKVLESQFFAEHTRHDLSGGSCVVEEVVDILPEHRLRSERHAFDFRGQFVLAR